LKNNESRKSMKINHMVDHSAKENDTLNVAFVDIKNADIKVPDHLTMGVQEDVWAEHHQRWMG
jgi:hypothetical protein